MRRRRSAVDAAFRALCKAGIYASTHEAPCGARCAPRELQDRAVRRPAQERDTVCGAQCSMFF